MLSTIARITHAVSRYSDDFATLGSSSSSSSSSTLPGTPLVDAVATLSIYTATPRPPNIESEKAKILRDARDLRDPIALHNFLQAAEVDGLAKAVAACFANTPHHPYARHALFKAVGLYCHAETCFVSRNQDMPARDHDASDDGYRANLFNRLDWVHQYGTLSDSIAGSQHTCLSMLTTYLQLILISTPMEQWAAAASAEPSDPSPLSVAWGWARDSPAISAHTVDVVVLVTMGLHIQRVVTAAAKAAAASERLSPPGFGETLFMDGFGAALNLLLGRQPHPNRAPLAQQSRPPRASSKDEDSRYVYVDDVDTAETLHLAVEKVRSIREQFAQLLTKPDIATQDAQHLVYLLSEWLKIIVNKAEPLVPSSVLMAIPHVSGKQEGHATAIRASNPKSSHLHTKPSARSLRNPFVTRQATS